MKDQYVGDVNDFCKYALLRELAASHDGGFVVAWMRTSPDDRADGGRLAYLSQPNHYRSADPDLFRRLNKLVESGQRSVAAVQDAGILPGARFHSALLSDSRSARYDWFASLLSNLGPGDLVFVDPDNGLSVPSVSVGRRGSCKYLYDEELAALLAAGRSVCVYQHFPRRARSEYVRHLKDRVMLAAPAVLAEVVATSHVAFILAAPPAHLAGLLRAAARVTRRLPGLLRICE